MNRNIPSNLHDICNRLNDAGFIIGQHQCADIAHTGLEVFDGRRVGLTVWVDREGDEIPAQAG